MKLPTFSDYQPALLLHARPAADEQAWFSVAPPPGFTEAHARPGQFCKMRVGDAEGIFAMASPPGESPVRFLVRVGNPDGGEAADRIATLADDARLEMTGPAGEGFALGAARGRDVVFIATGTGIAPVRAAIEVVLRERDAYGRLTLIHGLRSEAHLAIGDDLERWRRAGLRDRLCFSSIDPAGRLGGVTVQSVLAEEVPDLADAAVIAVGQPEMLEQLVLEVVRLGGSAELFLKNI